MKVREPNRSSLKILFGWKKIMPSSSYRANHVREKITYTLLLLFHTNMFRGWLLIPVLYIGSRTKQLFVMSGKHLSGVA